MKIHFKKIVISFFVIAGFVIYGIYMRFNTGDIQVTSNGSLVVSGLPPSTSQSEPVPETASSSSGELNYGLPALKETTLYKDGQYDGIAADAYYGTVQVRVVIQSGKILDILFLSYPDDRSTSIEINNYAMPLLESEAITAQSAEVDIVSGATNTSKAFIESLSSALDQAAISLTETIEKNKQNDHSSDTGNISNQQKDIQVDIVTGATNSVSSSSSSSASNQSTDYGDDENDEEEWDD